MKSSCLYSDYSDSESAVFGATFHVFEWVYVRFSPLMPIGTTVGAILTKKKRKQSHITKSADPRVGAFLVYSKDSVRLTVVTVYNH